MLNFRALPFIDLSTRLPRFYRTGEITTLTEQEINYLICDLKINYFIDLRSTGELDSHGIPLKIIKAGLNWVSFPMNSDSSYLSDKKYPTAEDYYEYSLDLLERNQSVFYSIFQYFIKFDNKPIMFGCYAGKDRTGLLAILILLFYGVPRDIIVSDYLETGNGLLRNIDYFENNWIKRKLTKEEYTIRIQPKKETAIMLLDYVEFFYNGIDNYLKHIGLSANDLRKLKGLN